LSRAALRYPSAPQAALVYALNGPCALTSHTQTEQMRVGWVARVCVPPPPPAPSPLGPALLGVPSTLTLMTLTQTPPTPHDPPPPPAHCILAQAPMLCLAGPPLSWPMTQALGACLTTLTFTLEPTSALTCLLHLTTPVASGSWACHSGTGGAIPPHLSRGLCLTAPSGPCRHPPRCTAFRNAPFSALSQHCLHSTAQQRLPSDDGSQRRLLR